MNCNNLIEYVYKHEKIDALIHKIRPVEIQDDLKQELAIILLKYDCNKLREMYEMQTLIPFSLVTIWNMVTKSHNKFFKTYIKNDFEKAYDYLLSINTKSNYEGILIANKILDKKLIGSSNDAHESMIFRQYIEMRSCQKVADYFGIPHLHVFQVVKKMKSELKKAIKNQ